jgi:TonB family protein
LIELSPHARLPRLDLGIDWGNRGEEFGSSLVSFFKGPRAPKDSEAAGDGALRVEWVEGRLPFRAFTFSSLWHVGMVWLLVLPIWGFLPHATPNLAPLQIELTWYGEPKDLPPISLPARTPKPAAPRSKPEQAAKFAAQQGAAAFHPRQTILSIPARVTHPRQTLIRPDAPATPPKVVPQLPNIVQWKAPEPELAKPKFQLSAAMSAPKMQQRAVQNVAAPEVPNDQKNAGPMNIAPQTVAIARPKIPLSAMSAPKTKQREVASADAAAPEIGASGDSAMRNVIALSAVPGPPVPAASIPEGNLAARISISPAGSKSRESGGSATLSGASGAGGSLGGAAGTLSAGGSGGSSSLPAAISISGGVAPHTSGGGIGADAGRSGRLNLTPKEPYQPTISVRRGPIDMSRLAPGLPSEKILSGSEIYTMHVNLPNVTSASGSWILNFAELDEDQEPGYRRKERLADPVPVHVTDPRYPQDLIKEHVHGEVVLYAIIRKNGSVDSIQIVRDLDPQLDRDAIDALEKWTFEPATRAGVPVDVEAVIHVPFSYTDPRAYPTSRP